MTFLLIMMTKEAFHALYHLVLTTILYENFYYFHFAIKKENYITRLGQI